ncbi:MAG: creatininase family protein [Alistipes sp.]|jgi:creatinine amidohydrolase|nr:creatininase family protein [Alistipes sp.]
MKKLFLIAAAVSMTAVSAFAQAQAGADRQLPAGWDELTGPDFKLAVEQAEGVCVIPMGVVEKHGPHMPLGTDVFSAREVARRAVADEYAVVYPFYFVGQIHEAKQQPGTIAYSPELVYRMLEETCEEISRNGMKKIILNNSHGGNTTFLEYFCQSQLAARKDYVVYLFQPSVDRETAQRIRELRKSETGGHADEVETSTLIVAKPDLMRMETVNDESGEDLNRLDVPNLYTGIWWYAKYPNHYAGESSGASVELGEVALAQKSAQLAEVIRTVKRDADALKLQDEFFRQSDEPLKTPIW